MNKYINLVAAFFLLGIVDQVHKDFAVVELSDSDGVISTTTLPKIVFPCSVSEGDMFYIVNIDGVVEIRCGEPPD